MGMMPKRGCWPLEVHDEKQRLRFVQRIFKIDFTHMGLNDLSWLFE